MEKKMIECTVNKIVEVEKLYKRNINGSDKKTKVISSVKYIFGDIDEDLLSELIDVIVDLVNNEKIYKLFKKGYKMCF